jgi:pimeloyl-ACP methyl ester carboxylesterase
LDAVVYDRIGYGKSAANLETRTHGYLHDEANRMLPAFLDKLKIRKPILFGHSDGGTIALLYASAYETHALICEAGHILVEEETVRGIRKAGELRDGLVGKLTKYHGGKAEILFDSWQGTWLDPDFQNWSIEEVLNTINCPALIMQGENDEYATRNHMERIRKGIGDSAQSLLIKNCGHIPHLEAQVEVLEESAKFIRSVL